MLRNATANSREVSARVLSALQANAGPKSIAAEHGVQTSQPLSPQVSPAFGDVLMGNGDGGEDAVITVYVSAQERHFEWSMELVDVTKMVV